MNFKEYTVPQDFIGSKRLDQFVASVPDGMNRSRLKAVEKEIFVNGKNQKLSFKVKSGDKIKILWEENLPTKFEPENIPLEIIYEDENVCVINKRQGMVCHPACGNWNGTLVNALLYHWGKNSINELNPKDSSKSEILANRRPGIVHRLDKETSGIIITAKNPQTHEFLASQFKNHKSIQKEYIAICIGRPPQKIGTIKTQIIRDPKKRKQFKATLDENSGKFAETHYKCLACYGNYSLMRLRIKTGRTHQIRVHLKFINCPILGDSIYSKKDKNFPNASLMLHSKSLKIKIPPSSKTENFKISETSKVKTDEIKTFEVKKDKNGFTTFKTSTPDRFKKVMKILHQNYKKVILQD